MFPIGPGRLPALAVLLFLSRSVVCRNLLSDGGASSDGLQRNHGFLSGKPNPTTPSSALSKYQLSHASITHTKTPMRTETAGAQGKSTKMIFVAGKVREAVTDGAGLFHLSDASPSGHFTTALSLTQTSEKTQGPQVYHTSLGSAQTTPPSALSQATSPSTSLSKASSTISYSSGTRTSRGRMSSRPSPKKTTPSPPVPDHPPVQNKDAGSIEVKGGQDGHGLIIILISLLVVFFFSTLLFLVRLRARRTKYRQMDETLLGTEMMCISTLKLSSTCNGDQGSSTHSQHVFDFGSNRENSDGDNVTMYSYITDVGEDS